MVTRAQAVKAAPAKVEARTPLTMQGLWRMTLWGTTAATALLVAVLTTRSEVGAQRVGTVLSSLSGHTPGERKPFDAQAEARRLAEAVRDLTAENDQLRMRVAAVEHNMDDLTGSITRQIEAAKAETPPKPSEAPPAQASLADTAAVAAAEPAPSNTAPQTVSAQPAAAASPPGGAASAAKSAEYGVDVGSASSIQALRARWLGLSSAHPQLFTGLLPTVALRDVTRSNRDAPETQHSTRAELRLVVGPLASSKAAAQLCTALAQYRLYCQPTVFDRQHMALD